jgi:hypothetical protein
MKNIALLISLLFLVGCDDPTGGGKLTITKHENGKTASRGYMLNDHIKVGDWIYFYDDGSKEKVGRYFEDQMHGVWTSWHKNGQKATDRRKCRRVTRGRDIVRASLWSPGRMQRVSRIPVVQLLRSTSGSMEQPASRTAVSPTTSQVIPVIWRGSISMFCFQRRGAFLKASGSLAHARSRRARSAG